MPYYPYQEKSRNNFIVNTEDIKLASDYTAMPFPEIWKLDIFEFWGYLHDAVVWECSRSENGREFLDSAFCIMQSEPDREALSVFRR